MGIFGSNFNWNVMGKVHTITAVAAFIFVIIMLLIIIHPLDFANNDIETIYHDNVGLIWFIGIGASAGILLMTYVNGVFQQDLKHCAVMSDKKTDQINTYNKEILKNQMHYIRQIDELTSSINSNIAMVNKQNEVIDKVYKRVEDSEEKIQEFMSIHKKIEDITTRTNSIEKLLKEHNKEIDILKKNK